jgi:membrane protease YdiL (CAAX protease family)
VTRRTFERGFSLLAAAFAAWPALSSVAFACPMCFNGNNTNQSAFLYGSLFLMIVPVTAIGSLLYWAYRRSKALETQAPPAPPAVQPGEAQPRPALHIVRR